MVLDKRQRIILIILIILIIILGWLLFGGRKKDTFGPTLPPALNAKSGQAPIKLQPITEVTPQPMPGQKPIAAPATPTVNSPAVKPSTPPLVLAPDQAEYLHAVDEYQLAQIKRMLAEQEAATAQANLTKEKANVELNQLAGVSLVHETTAPKTPTPQPTTYQVVFIGTKNGQWSATLLSNTNSYIDVNIGSVLPAGEEIISIKNDGVTLKQNDKTSFLMFVNNPMG